MVPNAICTKMFLTLLAFISLYSVDCEAVSYCEAQFWEVPGDRWSPELLAESSCHCKWYLDFHSNHPPPPTPLKNLGTFYCPATVRYFWTNCTNQFNVFRSDIIGALLSPIHHCTGSQFMVGCHSKPHVHKHWPHDDGVHWLTLVLD